MQPCRVIFARFSILGREKYWEHQLAQLTIKQNITNQYEFSLRKTFKKKWQKVCRYKNLPYLCTRNQEMIECLFSSVGRARHS